MAQSARINHYVLTLTGSAQLLSTVLGSSAEDISLRGLWLQPNAANVNLIYLGGSTSTVTSSNYGVRLETPASSIPPPPFNPGELDTAPMKLSDFYVLGTGPDKLHILTVAYVQRP